MNPTAVWKKTLDKRICNSHPRPGDRNLIIMSGRGLFVSPHAQRRSPREADRVASESDDAVIPTFDQ
jgi:hypothetical protein